VSDLAVIRAYIVDSFLLGDGDGLADGDSLIESGALDSTGVVEVVTFLEETFRIEVADDDLVPENLDSIERLTDFVQRKREGVTASPRALER
jgi:acyl carrier protein